MSGAYSKHEGNIEKEKVSIEEPGQKEHIRDLDAYVCTMYKHAQKNQGIKCSGLDWRLSSIWLL